ncbi:hypothetical protein E4U41_000149 [Claviceps citrina]|nr:hypothetical protein E4U41_000149 [Claviceps citrina]
MSLPLATQSLRIDDAPRTKKLLHFRGRRTSRPGTLTGILGGSGLFVDEPTTGVGCHERVSACTECEVSCAHKGRTIIMMIQQPISEVWPLFDNLMVLSQGGWGWTGCTGKD